MTVTFPLATGSEPDAGLTLVELLVLMAILGMALVLGSTSWLRWREARELTDTAAKVALLIKDARTEARRTGTVVSVAIDPANQRLEIASMHRSLALPPQIQIWAQVAQLGGPASVELLPDGSSTGADIRLSKAGQSSLDLTVSWIDGQVRRAQ